MSVRKRPDRPHPTTGKPQWQADVCIRKKRRKPLFPTEKAALEFERRAKMEKKYGLKDEIEPILISAAFPSYFKSESSQKSAKSRDNDERYLNFAFHFFTVERGHEYLDDIELEDLQEFQRWIQQAHKCGKEEKSEWAIPTVARCCNMLKHLFHLMTATKRLKSDPSVYWKIESGESKRRRPMTQWEFEQLLTASQDWYKPILRTMRLTGARGSSLAGLTWGDIDLARRLIVLRSRKGGRKRVKEITLPIVDELFSMLVSMRNANPWLAGSDPVFRDGAGDPASPEWISAYGNRLMDKIGLDAEELVIYGLRHALATDMTEAGISLEIVRQSLGHSSVQTTQNYARGIGLGSVQKAIESVRSATGTDPNVPKERKGDA